MLAKVEPKQQLARFRGKSYVAFVFAPVVPIADWLEEVDATMARSPGFFVGRPVVLDLAAVDLSTSGIAHLLSSLETRNIRVLGIEGTDPSKVNPGMPPLLMGGRNCILEHRESAKEEAKPRQSSLLLKQPVRSGQSIVHTEGDVIVLGSVGSGAEIVAGGSIHVYGTLRGRAMAGVDGNLAARIFCQKIEAELLAIDGYYQTAENIDPAILSRPAQAWLEDETLKITPLI
jgi:septum site-determining protein MinC